MNKFVHSNFNIGNVENGAGCDITDFCKWEIGKLAFKCVRGCWRDLDKQTSVDFVEHYGCFDIDLHAEAPTDTHLCRCDTKSTFAEVMCGFDKSAFDGLMQSMIHLRRGGWDI